MNVENGNEKSEPIERLTIVTRTKPTAWWRMTFNAVTMVVAASSYFAGNGWGWGVFALGLAGGLVLDVVEHWRDRGGAS